MFPFQDDNPIQRTPVVTYAIIAINVLVFLWMLRLPEQNLRELEYHRGFVPARVAQLASGKDIPVSFAEVIEVSGFRQPFVRQQRLWLPPARREILLSLLTCMFLHGGWMHLIGNMWFLWIFGDNVEDRLGSVLYLLFYLTGGALATACHWAADPQSTMPIIGASGAISAVLGAYAITWPWARVHTLVFLFIFITVVDLPAMLFLGIWFIGQVLSSAQQSHGQMAGGVAWWAHIGGFVAGFVLMPVLSLLVAGHQQGPLASNPNEENLSGY
jgi:membrane associated rhomboid family serine protease